MYVITADSTVDLPAELVRELGIKIVPFVYTLDGTEYENHPDYRAQSPEDYYAALSAGKLSTTTQVSMHRYAEFFREFLADGLDVLHLSLSGGLSKSYEQSLLAASEMQQHFPDRKVVAIDTRSASLGQGLIAYNAASAQAGGMDFGACVRYIHSMIPNVHHWIMADDLHHLRRGGRVSGAQAFVGTMLNIKPILTIIPDGRIVPVAKTRGRAKAVDFICKMVREHKAAPGQKIAIGHTMAAPLAQTLMDEITTQVPDAEFLFNFIGPVIGAHTGPGTIAAAFVGGARFSSS